MALPAKYDISMYAGDTDSFSFRLRNSDATIVSGLEYATALFSAVDGLASPPHLVKTGVVNSETGSVTFSFLPEDTSNIVNAEDPFNKRTLQYDIQLTFKDELGVAFEVKTVLRGKLTILEDVTK